MKNLSPLLITLLATGSQAALVAHYDMEQASSPIVDQMGGQTASAVDGGHQYSVTGPAGFGNAVGLNANGAWQLSVADSAELDLANNFTVASWLYFDSAKVAAKTGVNFTNHRIIGDDAAWDSDGWSFGVRGTQLIFTKNGVVDQINTTGTTVPFDQWVHVAAVVSSTSGVTFYLNGTDNGTHGDARPVKLNGTGNNAVLDPYGIGRTYGSGEAQWFAGNLDEVKVFDTTLSQPEIAALMVPEPSVTLLAASVLGLAMIRRRR